MEALGGGKEPSRPSADRRSSRKRKEGQIFLFVVVVLELKKTDCTCC